MSRDDERNFWGWGSSSRFPDEDGRRAVAGHAAQLLGFSGLELRHVPTLDDVALRAPRVTPPASLTQLCTADKRDRVLHTYGRGYRDVVRGLAADFGPSPDLVAHPRDEADVDALLAWCSAERIAAIPFGGGTSVVAGIEPIVGDAYAGVVSIDLRGLDRVLEIDSVSRAARIQAGATGPVLERQLAEHGLSLRFYPQSFEYSTLGGWIVTRAGGHYATLYTHIDDLVESVRLVTPRGLLETRRLPASGAGPSPDRFVLGSEGTLGVLTEAWVRIVPRPRWRSSASVRFATFVEGARAVRAISQAGLYPANTRLLDPREALLNAVAAEGQAVLILGFESADHEVDAPMARALAICAELGGRCPEGPRRRDAGDRGGDAAAERWRKAFFDAPYLQTILASVGVIADTFETACTWDRFEALHAGVTEAVTETLRRVCGGGGVTCRLTHVYPDGPAPYFTFVAPARAGAELDQWAEIKRAASDALHAHGGTITHHHAVGRLHRPWYDRERPELFADVLRAAKKTLDPAGILNPGVLFHPVAP